MQFGDAIEEPTPDKSGTVEPSVLAVLYDEVAQDLERQSAQIDRLNERAQQLFGFAAVILTIIAAVTPRDTTTATKVAFLCAIPLFARAAWLSGSAWIVRSWRGDPDVRSLWGRHRAKPEEHFRYQVILNRFESISANESSISQKLDKVKAGQRWLYGGFIYVAALIVFRLLFE